MKIKIIMIILLLSTCIFSQMHPKNKYRNRIEELEKIKLIEELNLDEETSARLIARMTENRQSQKDLQKKKMKLISEIEKSFVDDGKKDNKFCESRINSLLDIEKEMVSQREVFIKSLRDILTPEQILKTMIFEVKFREEIKDALIRKEKR